MISTLGFNSWRICTFFRSKISSALKWCTEPTINDFINIHFIVKSSFSEKATKIWKNLPLVLMLLSKTSVLSKQVGDFFQTLWPHNVWTLINHIKHYFDVIRQSFFCFCIFVLFPACLFIHFYLAHVTIILSKCI